MPAGRVLTPYVPTVVVCVVGSQDGVASLGLPSVTVTTTNGWALLNRCRIYLPQFTDTCSHLFTTPTWFPWIGKRGCRYTPDHAPSQTPQFTPRCVPCAAVGTAVAVADCRTQHDTTFSSPRTSRIYPPPAFQLQLGHVLFLQTLVGGHDCWNIAPLRTVILIAGRFDTNSSCPPHCWTTLPICASHGKAPARLPPFPFTHCIPDI